MLENIRKFSKTIFAKIILVIIIIPFVFWGMGGFFSSGNSNNIAKINNKNITTQDFIDYVNRSNINPERIKDEIDKNILEQILSELISKNMLMMEVKELDLNVEGYERHDLINLIWALLFFSNLLLLHLSVARNRQLRHPGPNQSR